MSSVCVCVCIVEECEEEVPFSPEGAEDPYVEDKDILYRMQLRKRYR